MQRNRWYLAVIAGFLTTLALGQVPGKIPPIKLPPAVPVKQDPAMAASIERQDPFIARYAYCNAMQLYQSRRAAWEPIYRDAGASSADLDTYSGDLVNYFKEFCSNGRPANYWQAALARIEAFDHRVDAAMAGNLGISVPDATELRISRVLVELEKFRERCMGGGQAAIAEDQVSVFGSLLPATSAPPGLTLERRSGLAATGKCSSRGGTAGSASGSSGVDRDTLSTCVAAALAQSGSCVSPVGEGPTGTPVDTQDWGGRCTNSGTGTEVCSQNTRYVYANGAVTDVSRQTTTIKAGDDRTHTIVSERRMTVGNENEVIADVGRTWVDGDIVAQVGTGAISDSLYRVLERSAPEATVPLGFRAVMRSTADPTSKAFVRDRRVERIPGLLGGGAAPSGRRDCASVNPGSSQPLGLARVVSSGDDRGSPIHAGHLDTWDMVGQCVCNSVGRVGPKLAAASGFKCGGADEDTRRLDCLLNPRGPVDGIRPECVAYLNADNPGRDTPRALSEWCGRVAQCPPGAGMATTSATGGAMCSCGNGLAAPRGGGSGTPGGSTCARVSCAQGPGAAGSDLYQQCCGVPGDVPGGIDPSSGPSVPPPRGPPSEVPKMPVSKMPMQPLPPK